MFTKENNYRLLLLSSLWNITYVVMLIYEGYEEVTAIYDNVSGTSTKTYCNMVTKYLKYFQISQIVSGQGSQTTQGQIYC